MTKCVRAPKNIGESVRSYLASHGYLDINSRIRVDNDYIFIPVVCDTIQGYKIVDTETDVRQDRMLRYKDMVDIPDIFRKLIPSSFDIVGDIAMIRLPQDLILYKYKIGEALIKANSSIRVVFLDMGVKGVFRVRDLERIAGVGSSETIYKEFGIYLYIDPTKVYFNPRLSSERSRIASLVKDGEIIIDMFAGVAPFGIMMCKLSKPKIVYSIDLNPNAEYFVRLNAKKNHIDNIMPMTGDSSKLIYSLPMADRIIMNLPQTSDKFMQFAISHLKSGGVIHMYKILERDSCSLFCKKLADDMKKDGYTILISSSEMKTYSPTMSIYSLDITKLQ